MQKNMLLFCCSLAMLLFTDLQAQCNLAPEIAPANLVLCPNATDTLYTTKEYDTYQWYKGGKLLPGANSRYLPVTQYEDAGYHFTVTVTLSNCKATADKVLVDGWVFASPTMASSVPPRHTDYWGTSYYCPNDSLVFTFLPPYTNNIQWYNHYEPIKGANAPTYLVTGSGSYTVCGSPQVCPDFTACQNLAVPIVIDTPHATVTRRRDTLVAGKGKRYQWSLNGQKIEGATGQQYIAKKRGIYRVTVWNKYDCADVSKPVLYLDLKGVVTVWPNPAAGYVYARTSDIEGAAYFSITNMHGTRRLQLPFTSASQRIDVSLLQPGVYVLQVLDKNSTILASTTFLKQ